MRHAVGWVALAAFALGVSILIRTAHVAHDRGQVAEAASIEFAAALIEIAITVGVVDLLLKSHSERQHRQSVSPRIAELAAHLRNLSVIAGRYLTAPTLGDLERYRRVAVDVQQAAFGIYILVSSSNAVLASDLLRLSHQMRDHIEAIEDALAACRNASVDVDKVVQRLTTAGSKLSASGGQLADQLAMAYPPSGRVRLMR